MAKMANLKKAVYKCKQEPGKIFQTFMEEKSLVKKIRAYPGLSDLLTHEDYREVIPAAKSHQEALQILLKEITHMEPPHGILAFEIESVE